MTKKLLFCMFCGNGTMGISGLLLALKPVTTVGNIRDYAGQPVAIDASSWLHKSVYSIADHYVECMERNALDRRCIDTSSHYIIQRCQELLQHAGISKIYLVLDGKRCPLKAVTNAERESRRADNLQQARKWKHTNPHQSNEKYKACIKVTDELTKRVVATIEQTFRNRHNCSNSRQPPVEIVWSPYEADAQLVQLAVDGRANAIITEDSDVLVYSAARQIVVPVLYKLDRHTGQCDVVSMEWLLSDAKTSLSTSSTTINKTANAPLTVLFDILKSRQQRYPGWGSRLFVQSCVLAGCDYAPRQLNGVGYITALKLVKNASTTPAQISKVLSTILTTQLKPKARQSVPDMQQFEILLAQSEAVFYYHPVADSNGIIQHLHPIITISNKEKSSSSLAPSLDRFENPFEFMGSLVANGNADAGIIPPSVPASSRKTTALHRHNLNHGNNKENFLPIVTVPKTIINPYHRSCRPPLQNKAPITMAVVDNDQDNQNNNAKGNDSTTLTRINPFESYAKRHREVGIQNINEKYTMRRKRPTEKSTILDFYYNNKEDVRYVKRTFPKHQQQKQQQQQQSFTATMSEHTMIANSKSSEANRTEKTSSPPPCPTTKEITKFEPSSKPSPLRDVTDRGHRRTNLLLRDNRSNSVSNSPLDATTTTSNDKNPNELDHHLHRVKTKASQERHQDTESSLSEVAELSEPESHRQTSRFFASSKYPQCVEQDHPTTFPTAFNYEDEEDDVISLSNNQRDQNNHQDQSLFQNGPASILLNPPCHQKYPQSLENAKHHFDSQEESSPNLLEHGASTWWDSIYNSAGDSPQDDDIGCVRRFTMEISSENDDSAPQSEHHQPPWDIYEDCHLKTPRDKQIVDLSGTDKDMDESSSFENHAHEITQKHCISVVVGPKIQSTIGPAKTFHDRFHFHFGKPPEQKKKGLLERILQRKRSTKNKDDSKKAAAVVQVHSRKRVLHFAFGESNKCRRSNNADTRQSSLHSHFAPRSSSAKVIFSDRDDI